ncbi:hypothetical protein N9046_01760 [Akkermansiaceae bacterium]|nr:hypothetical protein [Akkermansiaceae bacterium]MDB4658085.1 hypothetical protein [bacterium]
MDFLLMKRVFLTILIACFTFSGCGPSEEEISKVSLAGSVFIKTQGGESIKLSLVPIGVSTAEEYEAACASVLEDIISTAEGYLPLIEENYNLAKPLNRKIKAEKVGYVRFSSELDSYLKKVKFRGDYYINSFREVQAGSGGSGTGVQEIVTKANSLVKEANKRANNAKAEAYKARELEMKNNKMITDLDARFSSRTRAVIDLLHSSNVATRSDSDGKFSVELEPEKDYVLTGLGTRTVGSSSETYNWIVKINLSKGEKSKEVFFSNSELTSDIPGDESASKSIIGMNLGKFTFSTNDTPKTLEKYSY